MLRPIVFETLRCLHQKVSVALLAAHPDLPYAALYAGTARRVLIVLDRAEISSRGWCGSTIHSAFDLRMES